MFRREWRQQLLVLALMAVAVAATVFALGAAAHTPTPDRAILTLPGNDRQLDADVAAIARKVGGVDVILHQAVEVPGTVTTVDLRSVARHGRPGSAYDVVAGRAPSRAGEVALTRSAAELLGRSVGDTWTAAGTRWRVVGLVEDPTELAGQFALVAPGQVPEAATAQVILFGPASQVRGLRLPSGSRVGVEVVTAGSGAVAGVLALGTLGLLFVGLVAAAGFVVVAQRRERALGMLGAMGATDRHIRLVVLANGAVVGVTGAAAGAAAGLAAWLAFAPRLETLSGHRFDRFDLPWTAIAAAMALAVLCAVIAAWWPARAAARTSIVGALSGRRPRPRPAHRFALAGTAALVAGLAALAVAQPRRSTADPSPIRVIGGTLGVALGVLLLAPLAIAALAAIGRRWPVAIRLPLRDLARYQARSAAALAAITLAVGVAAALAVSAAAQANLSDPGLPNLAPNQVLVYLGARGNGGGEMVPDASAAQLAAARSAAAAIARSIHGGDPLELVAAVDPNQIDAQGPGGQSGKAPAMLFHVRLEPSRPGDHRRGFSASPATPLYLLDPIMAEHYGLDRAPIGNDTDIVTGRGDLAGTELLRSGEPVTPVIERSSSLPATTSGPSTLLTQHGLERLGLTAQPVAWLIEVPGRPTAEQLGAARRLAATSGVTIETAEPPPSGARLGNIATAIGIGLALGVLAMTVGLIRSEAAADLRTLTATGASSTTRRTLTAATAAALALLGGILGTAAAYAALAAWNRHDLHPLTSVPVLDLALLVLGLPAVAATAGWLLAGREPAAIGRRPLE